jgi:hypothetical protein
MSQVYVVKLSEQEELNLRQVMQHVGADAVIKLLQGESLAAQAEAMDCTDADSKKRLQLLTDAQAMRKAVSKLTQKLYSYRALDIPATPSVEEVSQVIDNIWEST